MKHMKYKHNPFSSISVTLGMCLFISSAVSAPQVMHQPVAITHEQISFHWWLQDDTAHTVNQVQLLANSTPIPTAESRLSPDPDLPLCTLFMTDTSLSMKNQLHSHVVPLLTALLQARPAHHFYALGRFDTGLEILTPLSQDSDTLMQSIQKLQLKGQRTELFRSALTGLETLQACQGYRRILVILSDGDAEDLPGAYALDDVIEAARVQKTPLITVGFNDSIQQQNLRRLSEKSGGWYWPYQASEVTAFTTRLTKITDNGGWLRINRADVPTEPTTFTLTLTLDNDQTLSAPVAINLPVAEPMPVPAWQAWLQQRFPEVPIRNWLIGLGSLLGLLLLLLLVFIVRRRKPSDSDEIAKSQAQKLQTPLAFVEADDQVLVMDQYSISIGALPENDWVIDDPTVSRYQATLDYKDHQFHLTDRGSTNPSQVNGQVIQHCILQAGDEIQLGDWRGYFRLQ